MCSSGCSTTPSPRSRRRRRISTGCCSPRSAIRRLPAALAFAGPNDPGVLYGADAIRTACAELGYWRWRHLLDSPALTAMPTKPQTVFQVKIEIDAVDLRAKPFARDRRRWTDASDYSRCQDFGRTARAARRRRHPLRVRPRSRSMMRAARCCRLPRSLLRFRSSSRRGCCRSPAIASSGSERMRSTSKSTNSPQSQWSPSAH